MAPIPPLSWFIKKKWRSFEVLSLKFRHFFGKNLKKKSQLSNKKKYMKNSHFKKREKRKKITKPRKTNCFSGIHSAEKIRVYIMKKHDKSANYTWNYIRGGVHATTMVTVRKKRNVKKTDRPRTREVLLLLTQNRKKLLKENSHKFSFNFFLVFFYLHFLLSFFFIFDLFFLLIFEIVFSLHCFYGFFFYFFWKIGKFRFSDFIF